MGEDTLGMKGTPTPGKQPFYDVLHDVRPHLLHQLRAQVPLETLEVHPNATVKPMLMNLASSEQWRVGG